MREEVREAIEEACAAQVADGGLSDRKGRPIPFARAADLIRRFAENAPADMSMTDLCDELCHANNQQEEW